MSNKKAGIIITIISVCIAIIIGIVYMLNSDKFSEKNKISLQETFNSLSDEEKQQVIELKNEVDSEEFNILDNKFDELPQAIQDIINPPNLKNGLNKLLNTDK